jgi:2-polyprenyl-3-methyl-5-hydroxy-6-metoxy-1,4-benzoquinol methylase
MPESTFDYTGIPVGFYDQMLRGGNPIRRLWHLSKFERVLDALPRRPGLSLLDVGCFAGSFLSLVPEQRFPRQLGVDILPEQVAWAEQHHGTGFRRFRHVADVAALEALPETFDAVTLIEVIEHLGREEAGVLLRALAMRTVPGGVLILTTPNYASGWPVIEWLVDLVSSVKYEEQHVTHFTFFGIERQLRAIHPGFFDDFELVLKTTSHLATPFLAAISFRLAHWLSRAIPHRHWHLPFGSLVMLVCRRRTAPATPA